VIRESAAQPAARDPYARIVANLPGNPGLAWAGRPLAGEHHRPALKRA
jgi:hypothetical protein